MKTCRACGESKPLDDFHRDSASADGRRPRCRVCVKLKDDERREERNRKAREKYAVDPQAKIAKTRQYHLDNPEWSRERLRAHHVANAEERARRAAERGKDPAIAAARRDATRRSESRRRAQKQGAEADYVTTADILSLLERSDHRCYICGRPFGDGLPYTIDHIQPLARGGQHVLSNLAPSCGPCNVRKNARWPLTEDIIAEIRSAVLLAVGEEVTQL